MQPRPNRINNHTATARVVRQTMQERQACGVNAAAADLHEDLARYHRLLARLGNPVSETLISTEREIRREIHELAGLLPDFYPRLIDTQ